MLMDWAPMKFLAAASIGVAFAFLFFPVQAQMYPQDLHSSQKGRWAGRSADQPSFGGMGVDSASEFLQRREEQDRERREMIERQRRMMENYTNIPDQLRESYFFRRPGDPFNSR
jgi:hypothetical protein